MQRYDLIILGGGPAGLVAAKVARGLGKSVAIIEKNKIGGECTWTGCVPSKTLIHFSNLISSGQELEKKGMGIFNPSFQNVMNLVREKRNEIYQTHTPEILKQEGIDSYFGSPKFIDKNTVELGSKKFKAKKFIVATGSRPFIPNIEGIQGINYLTNETVFELESLPKSMVILGGGPIGIEMGCALNKLGVKIIVIERAPHILSKEDPELTTMLKERMTSEGIDVRTSLKLVKVSQNGEKIKCICIDAHENTVELAGETLLVSVGRKPNIEGLVLENIGVSTTSKGIIVDNTLRTSVSTIYACGDVVGPYLFSHMAEYQATIATTNALIPLYKKRIDYNDVIWVTFSNPELASAGLNESQAREKCGNSIRIHRLGYDAIDRAKIDDKTFGICKVICDRNGKILGAHILGAHAGELIHEIQLGKYYNHTISEFYNPIHAYPTYSELIWQLAKKAYVKNISEKWYVKLFSALKRGKDKK